VRQSRRWPQNNAGHYVEPPAGSIQLISAGRAIYPSEFSHCRGHNCHVRHIWIRPRQPHPASAYQ
jgi:redox-sensitive bicupin YhaK (pirin superfamily)